MVLPHSQTPGTTEMGLGRHFIKVPLADAAALTLGAASAL